MKEKEAFMPFINKKAQAGFIRHFGEKEATEDFEYYRIPGFIPAEDTMLIEVEGNNMLPTVLSGDILICQAQKDRDYILDDSIVVIISREKLISTRVFEHENENYLWMISDNPQQSERERIRKKDIRELYMVVGKTGAALISHEEKQGKRKLKTLEKEFNSLISEVSKLKEKLNDLS